MTKEELYCMGCGYVYTPIKNFGECYKCGSEDYAMLDKEKDDDSNNWFTGRWLDRLDF